MDSEVLCHLGTSQRPKELIGSGIHKTWLMLDQVLADLPERSLALVDAPDEVIRSLNVVGHVSLLVLRSTLHSIELFKPASILVIKGQIRCVYTTDFDLPTGFV